MSAYKKLKGKMSDKETLIAALTQVEWKPGHKWTRQMIEVHDTPVGMSGYSNEERANKANILVRKQHMPGCYNDIGFVWNPETEAYDLIISDLNTSMGLSQKWLDSLGIQYGMEAVKKVCEENGYNDITWHTNKDGSVEAEISVGATSSESWGGNF